MKKLFLFLMLFSTLVVTVYGESKKIDAEHENYNFVCPQVILQLGINFGFTGKFPKMKDFVNPEFLNENYSIEEIKKVSGGYYIVYGISAPNKLETIGSFTIWFSVDNMKKNVSFYRVKAELLGVTRCDVTVPSNTSDGRELGFFYGTLDKFIPTIFDMKKMNAAIN